MAKSKKSEDVTSRITKKILDRVRIIKDSLPVIGKERATKKKKASKIVKKSSRSSAKVSKVSTQSSKKKATSKKVSKSGSKKTKKR